MKEASPDRSIEIHVLARISLLSANEGGRKTSLVPDNPYRPNHNFGIVDDLEMGMGEIKLSKDQTGAPGDIFETEIRLFVATELVPIIVPGRTWLIQEGARLVGKGTVIALL